MKLKPLHWIASSKKDLMRFPEAVRDEAGFALYLAQAGNMALGSVPMVGFGGSKVVEVVIDNRGNTFRAVLHGQVRARRLRSARVSEEVEAGGQNFTVGHEFDQGASTGGRGPLPNEL